MTGQVSGDRDMGPSEVKGKDVLQCRQQRTGIAIG